MAGQTGINPLLAFLPPDEQQNYAQLQQRQAIGQALLQQGLQPMDAGQNAVGGMAYHVSPLNGVSKLLNTYLGNKLSMDAAGQQAQLMSQMYGNAFGTNQPQQQGAPSASADPSQTPDAGGIAGGGSGPGVQSSPIANPFQPSAAQIGQQLTGAAQPARGPLTIPGTTPQQSMMLMSMAPEAYSRAMGAALTPTDATRMAIASGTDPRTANAGALFHANYVAPVQIGANQTVMDPRTGAVSTTPSAAADGSQNILGADGKWYTVPVTGGAQAIAAAAAARAGGEGSQLPYAGVDAQGNPLPVTNRTAAATGAGNANQPPPIPTLPGLQPAGAPGASDVPLPSGPVPGGGAMYAAPPMGATTSADTAARGQQEDLAKKWSDLNSENQQAQSVISNLQNIKTLAGKAAVGPQSDRIAYANGLLSLAGSERATDATTANNLLDKYSNQIVTRLSQGGMGTDAARSILQSAYPNAHMTLDAINEASDNLIGGRQMVQAKARVLAPYRTKNDAPGYTNTELTFDQNADPRIFQYANIRDPAARQAFAKNLMQQDPTIVQKIQTLQSLGALK
jgi:hypothetical protein